MQGNKALRRNVNSNHNLPRDLYLLANWLCFISNQLLDVESPNTCGTQTNLGAISDVLPTLPCGCRHPRTDISVIFWAGQKGGTSQAPAVKKNDALVGSQLSTDPSITFSSGHHQGDSSTDLVIHQTSPSRRPRVTATEGHVFKNISSPWENCLCPGRRDEAVSTLPGQLVPKWSSPLTVYPPCLPWTGANCKWEGGQGRKVPGTDRLGKTEVLKERSWGRVNSSALSGVWDGQNLWQDKNSDSIPKIPIIWYCWNIPPSYLLSSAVMEHRPHVTWYYTSLYVRTFRENVHLIANASVKSQHLVHLWFKETKTF